jgi:hypothetical protein
MKSKWESRERSTRRIALIVSVMLHMLAIAMISTGTGGDSIQNVIENIFGKGQHSQEDLAETKV